jgi:hypothetical protein
MAEFIKNGYMAQETPDKLKYWEVQNIPNFIVNELRRRKNSNNIGFEYTEYNPNSKQQDYKGPMTPWIRVFSNGTGLPINTRVPMSDFLKKNNEFKKYEGFILEGGKGFNQAFGLSSDTGNGNRSIFTEQSNAIIGYQSNGKPHYVDNNYRNLDTFSTKLDENYPQNNTSPVMLPPPGVISADIKTSGEMMTFAEIKFKCYSIAQVEYLVPFFMTPGVNLFVEFGWNLFDKNSLLNLDDTGELFELYKKPSVAIDRFAKSNGNYGLAMGPITNYNFNTKDGIEYDCSVKITDRQALFQGFRIDTDSTKDVSKDSNGPTEIDFTDKNKINFKNLLRTYLPFLDECISAKKNFQSYIKSITNISDESKEYNFQSTTRAGTGAPGGVVTTRSRSQENDSGKYFKLRPNPTTEKFFGGKPETRVFFGRNVNLLNDKNFSYSTEEKDNCLNFGDINLKLKKQTPLEFEEVLTSTPNIGAGRLTEGLNRGEDIIQTVKVTKPSKFEFVNETTNLYSDIDTTKDFDRADKSNEIWMQLDFLFELLNENIPSQFFNINYDIKVNAHPNLISCDKNVLIPNPIAPKIHRGSTSDRGGYLESSDKEQSNNFFTQPFADFSDNLDENHKLYKSYNKCRSVFRTGNFNESDTPQDKPTNVSFWEALFNQKDLLNSEKYDHSYGLGGVGTSKFTFERQNLDQIINYYSYVTDPTSYGEYAFPKVASFVGESGVEYKEYRYGNLKDLYISRSKVIEIANDDTITNLQQFVQEILRVINKSVNNYWLFDIVNDANGGLTIIDKSLNNLEEIYTFEVSSGNNVVKQINFDVSLSPENSTQILFSSGNNNRPSKEEELGTLDNLIDKKGLESYDLLLASKSLPSISFSDRFDLDGQILKERRDRISSSIEPDANSNNKKSENPEITSLQTYGSNNNGVLQMTFAIDTEKAGKSNIYYYLNLPSSMKSKMSEMLNDEDFERNTVMYSNVADNFIVDIKLEGIFGFRMFQHFAINNLPKPYVQGNCIFMVKEISHTISNGNWETNVTALLKGIHKNNISNYYLI